MTTPAYLEPAHEPEPTPDNDELVAAIAALLLVSASAALTAAAIAALFRRRGVRVTLEVVTVALRIASARTNHEPRIIGRSDVARGQTRLEAHYRAAYILNASRRIQAAVEQAIADAEARAAYDAAEAELDRARREAAQAAIRAASRRERSYELAHERARRRRLEAAVAVAEAADRWGPMLGWHAHDDDRTTPECREADGSNFRVDMPPIIGWPGTLHGGTCRCRAGRPFPGGPSTDEATGFYSRRSA